MHPEVLVQRIANAQHDVAYHEAVAMFFYRQAMRVHNDPDPAKSVIGFVRLGNLAKHAQKRANASRRELAKLRKLRRV